MASGAVGLFVILGERFVSVISRIAVSVEGEEVADRMASVEVRWSSYLSCALMKDVQRKRDWISYGICRCVSLMRRSTG